MLGRQCAAGVRDKVKDTGQKAGRLYSGTVTFCDRDLRRVVPRPYSNTCLQRHSVRGGGFRMGEASSATCQVAFPAAAEGAVMPCPDSPRMVS
jgi:hypothetical protein